MPRHQHWQGLLQPRAELKPKHGARRAETASLKRVETYTRRLALQQRQRQGRSMLLCLRSAMLCQRISDRTATAQQVRWDGGWTPTLWTTVLVMVVSGAAAARVQGVVCIICRHCCLSGLASTCTRKSSSRGMSSSSAMSSGIYQGFEACLVPANLARLTVHVCTEDTIPESYINREQAHFCVSEVVDHSGALTVESVQPRPPTTDAKVIYLHQANA